MLSLSSFPFSLLINNDTKAQNKKWKIDQLIVIFSYELHQSLNRFRRLWLLQVVILIFSTILFFFYISWSIRSFACLFIMTCFTALLANPISPLNLVLMLVVSKLLEVGGKSFFSSENRIWNLLLKSHLTHQPCYLR